MNPIEVPENERSDSRERVITAGIWIIVWIGVSVKIGGWRCSTCGSSKVSKIS